jgi:hypothetical protein
MKVDKASRKGGIKKYDADGSRLGLEIRRTRRA